jgi:NADPH:quinone reductase
MMRRTALVLTQARDRGDPLVRAVRLSAYGGSEVLQVVDVDVAAPGPGQLLVDLEVAGINFIDVYQRTGLYPISVSLPSGLGLEGVGTIVAVGAGVTDRSVGQRVAWADQLGSYAQQHVVAAHRTVIVPDGMDAGTACALMLQGITAHYLSFSTFPLSKGHTAVVFAAAGGVGRLLVQLAVQRGARVLACTSTPEKADVVRSLGAHEVIAYREVDVAATVRELTDGQGADVVYDSVGAATWESSLDSLRPRGTAVFYGNASGPIPPLDLRLLNRKGSLFVTRPSLADHIATVEELGWRSGALFGLTASGHLDVAVHGRYPLADIRRAHDDLESGTTSGKLLVDV